jgi:hypothetical protein
MRKTIIIFVILLIPAFSIQAGIKIGLKAGVNLANASLSNSSLKTDNFTGFQAGPILEIGGGFLGVDAAILYSQYGLKLDKETIKTSALDIPVNLKLKLSLVDIFGVYFSAGPYASFRLNDNIKAQCVGKDFGVGLNFGAGVELFKHFQVGANYQLALNNNYTDLAWSDFKDLSAKMRIWSITATFFF